MQTESLHQQLSSPSFSSYSSETLAQIAVRVIHELRTDDTFSVSQQQNDDFTCNQNDTAVDDFEFAFFSTDPISTADDIFHNGQITPTYPLFDQTLLNGVVSVSPTPLDNNNETNPRIRRLPLKMLMQDDAVGAEGSYCVWNPPCKKSSSTGSSSSKRWKLRDLLHRSHSDGKKESLLFFGAGGKHISVDNSGAGADKDGGRSKRKLGTGWVF